MRFSVDRFKHEYQKNFNGSQTLFIQIKLDRGKARVFFRFFFAYYLRDPRRSRRGDRPDDIVKESVALDLLFSLFVQPFYRSRLIDINIAEIGLSDHAVIGGDRQSEKFVDAEHAEIAENYLLHRAS